MWLRPLPTGKYMNEKLQQYLENLMPFLMLGIAIAIVIWLFIMFSYVLLWGLLIGGVLWVISLFKKLFFNDTKTSIESKGRIIEHNDKD
jgi:hypothetical protein